MLKGVKEKFVNEDGKIKGSVKLTATLCAVAIVATSTNAMLTANATTSQNSGLQNQYKEETVELGDIVVGVTEVGYADMKTTEVSFDFATTILEQNVKPGQYVNEGELIAVIDMDDFESDYADALISIESAQLDLEASIISGEASKLNAEKEYNENLLNGDNAANLHNLSLTELETGYKALLDDIEDLEEEKVEIEEDIDYGIYSAEAQDLKDEIDEIEEDIEKTESDIQDAYSNGQDTTLFDDLLKDLESDLTKKENELTNVYDALAESEDGLDDDLEKILEDIADKYLELENYEASMDMQKLGYDADYVSSLYDYENAQKAYTNEISQIDNTIKSSTQKLEELQKELEELEQMMTDGKVYAPCDGYVMSISEEGSDLNAGAAIVTLADNSEVNIEVSIPQEDIADISIGMDVNVVFDAYEDITMPAVVDSISITPSGGMASSVNYSVTVLCDISSYEEIVVYQSMTSNTTFIERQEKNALMVSNKCIINENGTQYVQMWGENGEVVKVEVTTGFSDGFEVQIIEGLSEGDIVLIESAVNTSAN